MIKKLQILIILFCCPLAFAWAQDDLLKELEQTTPKDTEYAFQTFKGTRLVNGQSVETKSKGTLEFIVAHRFEPINSGHTEMFGLDQAHVRVGLEYGITDRLGIGFGRNGGADKIRNAYLRYKVLRQQKGASNFPFTMTLIGDVSATKKVSDQSVDRVGYVGQMLIARKFSPHLSLQLMPTIVHRNAVDKATENNNQVAIGAGGRIKISKSVAFTSEYYYRVNPNANTRNYNAIGLGIDIETGGHVFQLVMTNTQGTTERGFITETTGNIKNGGIQFGFNVTRTFQLKKK
ncbi:MAG TPA: DUF5777 family beta-barrel protein [Cyclobacteriaceae bacterium]